MVYNQQVLSQLPQLGRDAVYASLASGTVTYTFLINPETMQWSHSASFSSLPVLGSSQPLVKYKYSDSRLTLPKVLLWTASNNLDISKLVDQLSIWCKLGAVLRFQWGSTIIPQCSIKTFSYTTSQIRSGKPTKAEANIELLIIGNAPAPAKQPLQVQQTAREKAKSS